MTGCARSTVIKYSQLGQFPPMIKLLGDRFAFVREDVQKWVDERLSSVK
jgi:predicted DNA-binding transcriptional regulator AlpA